MARAFDVFQHWRVPVPEEGGLSCADVVVQHEFGNQKTLSRTTIQIVRKAIVLARQFDIPLICQFPGDSAARAAGIAPALVIRQHKRKRNAYLDTEEVNRQVAELCVQRDWATVILVTHPHHFWRASENLRHHGLVVLAPDLSGIEYDRGCSRSSLRTPERFIPREILARLLYLARGRV